MVHIGVVAGVALLVLAVFAFFYSVPNVGYTFPEVYTYCQSGVMEFAQMFGGDRELAESCRIVQMITFAIYGSGLLGIILIIVGSVVPGKKHDESRKELRCEHCEFKTYSEAEIIEHYKLVHAKKVWFREKVEKTPLSPETLEILKQRYAKGEISKEEFENMKKDLV